MVGTTRSRVSFILNKFRKLGFIHYKGRMEVHSSLLNHFARLASLMSAAAESLGLPLQFITRELF